MSSTTVARGLVRSRLSPAGRIGARRRTHLMIGVVTLFSLAIPWRAAAQKSVMGAPVELTAHPRLVQIGMPVTLRGKTYVDGKRLQVAITVQPPEKAAAIKLTATVNVKEGTFSTTFKDTKSPGRYQVLAVSPDGQGRGETTFTVTTGGGLATKAAETLNEVMEVANEALGEVTPHAQAIPPSPVSQEVSKKLEDIEGKLAELRKPQADVAKALEAVAKMASEDSDVRQALEPEFRELGDWADTTDHELERIRERLRSAPEDVTLCDRIQLAHEGLNLLSLAMVFTGRGATLAGTGFSIFVNILSNNVVSPVVDKWLQDRSDPVRFFIAQNIKLGISALQGLGNVVTGVVGQANDVAAFLMKSVFPKYCTKFEGPVTASFDVTFFQAGAPWMHYSVQLVGRLLLRHSKDTPVGQPIRLTGEFEGCATGFTFDEDVGRLKPPELRGGRIMLRKRVTPTAYEGDCTKDPWSLGLFVRQGTTPNYFYVPVEGELVKDRIVMKTLDARVDFSEMVKNRLILIYVPPVLPIPRITTFDFPIQKAQFILSRGIEDGGAPEFKVAVEGDKQVIDRTFTRDEQPGETKVNFVVSVRATSG
ncbi:MAG: hypothetical protein ACRD2X_20610 [Vicinamibacteraceae bacterium]